MLEVDKSLWTTVKQKMFKRYEMDRSTHMGFNI